MAAALFFLNLKKWHEFRLEQAAGSIQAAVDISSAEHRFHLCRISQGTKKLIRGHIAIDLGACRERERASRQDPLAGQDGEHGIADPASFLHVGWVIWVVFQGCHSSTAARPAQVKTPKHERYVPNGAAQFLPYTASLVYIHMAYCRFVRPE